MPLAPPFQRVEVSFAVRGTVGVTWTIDRLFYETEPWTFQLEGAESGVPGANWFPVGDSVTGTELATVGLSLTDATARLFGKEFSFVYRVRLTTALGNSYVSAPADVYGDLDFHSWALAQEIVRKETLRAQDLGAAIDGLLLKTKRSGTPCPRCLDQALDEVTDSQCGVCFGQKFVGGYYTAAAGVWADHAPSARYLRQEMDRQSPNDVVATARMLAFPEASTDDAWVNRASDARFKVHKVQALAHVRGVPLINQVELRLTPFSDVLYTVPLT